MSDIDYKVNDTEAKILLKGALLYAHGSKAAFNDNVLEAAWCCFQDKIKHSCSIDEAIAVSVDDINLAVFK